MTYPTIGPFRSSGGGGSHVKTTERGSVGIATKFPGELLGAVNKQCFCYCQLIISACYRTIGMKTIINSLLHVTGGQVHSNMPAARVIRRCFDLGINCTKTVVNNVGNTCGGFNH